MAFIYIGCFVLFVVIIVNISDYSQNKKKKQNTQPRRVTVDSIETTMKSQQIAMTKIEQLTEDKLYKALDYGVKNVSWEIKENPDYLKKFMETLIEKQKAEMKNLIFDNPNLNSILSNQQINYSMMRQLKEFLNMQRS